MSWNNPDLTVYHGTDLASAEEIVRLQGERSHSIDISKSRKDLDFGQGFYVTTRLDQAIAWANRRQIYLSNNLSNKRLGLKYEAAVVKFLISRDRLAGMEDLTFVSADPGSDYWTFVGHCRKENPPGAGRSAPYAVVYGPVAKYPGTVTHPGMDQIGLHTSAALDLLAGATIFKRGTPLIEEPNE